MKKKSTSKKFDVICIGSATVDCFIQLPGSFAKIKQGCKLLVKDIDIMTGGGATNVAVGLRRLGMKSGFIGEVGEDHSAYIVKRELEKENVEFLVKQHSRHHTAYSVILEPKGGDRAILVYKGASSYLHPSELKGVPLNTNWFYFASVIGSSLKTLSSIAKIAKEKKTDVFFNPSGYMINKCSKETKRFLAVTTILSVNKEEAQALLKSRSKSPNVLLKGLIELGPKVCILTDGSKGALVYDGKNLVHQKPKNIKPIDTTGAGDSFNAGFLAGYILKKSSSPKERLVFAASMGTKNAESVIRHIGAKAGLLTKRKINY
ncbi:carbohydrate kinase family protein [Candidatus Woesearchaeota archaeon]|nr:carbohydrate kinase family protein [Candidatus Woesearchaeota archaeon]